MRKGSQPLFSLWVTFFLVQVRVLQGPEGRDPLMWVKSQHLLRGEAKVRKQKRGCPP